jgi:replicative DNA helicase
MKIQISSVSELVQDWHNNNKPLSKSKSKIKYFRDELGEIREGIHIIAGSQGIGKTAFLLTTAVRQQEAVLLFSLDVPKNELVKRIISQVSRVALSQISNNKELEGIQSDLNNKPLYIAENNCLNIIELQNTIHEFVKLNDIKLVIIDSLDVISINPNNWKDNEILLIMSTLKQIAIDLNIAILVSTEINCNGDKPSLKDIEYNSIIEQFANRILLIHRPEYYAIQEFDDGSSNKGKAEIMIIDYKLGATNDVRLNFDSKCLLFH